MFYNKPNKFKVVPIIYQYLVCFQIDYDLGRQVIKETTTTTKEEEEKDEIKLRGRK